MKLDIKLVVFVAICAALVQGRSGDPGRMREELLQRALKVMNEYPKAERGYPPSRGSVDSAYKAPSDDMSARYNYPPDFALRENDIAEGVAEEYGAWGKQLRGMVERLEEMGQSIGENLEKCGEQFLASFNDRLDKMIEEGKDRLPKPQTTGASEGLSKLEAAAGYVSVMSQNLFEALQELNNCNIQEDNDESNGDDIVDDNENFGDNDDDKETDEGLSDRRLELLTNLLAQRLSNLSKKDYQEEK